MHNKEYPQLFFIKIIVTVIILVPFLSACSTFDSLYNSIFDSMTYQETVESYPTASVIFNVQLPTQINANEKLKLEILDDVTGLFFNSTKYEMSQQDPLNYSVEIPLVVGSEVKYRYIREGSSTNIEYTAQNKPVRFRMVEVSGALLLQDSIAAWSDFAYTGFVGRIRGQLIDEENNAPIPNMLISVAGMQTISSSDGSFILDGLPVSTHNVVITSMDGEYEYFQQGAVIGEEATTPIFITMKKRPLVDVSFYVKMPDGFVTNLPLRFASNLYSQGNPYADLSSGSGTVSSNLPEVEKVSEDTYLITISLPAGMDLRYKFTFGDGFWNSELDQSGNFVVRELIVPTQNTTIRKRAETFISPSFGEITINVTTPANTPANEFVSLQLNPFGWMEPIHMLQIDANNWTYTLYSPLHLMGSYDFRFCRNDQCDLALSAASSESTITNSGTSQTVAYAIEYWQDLPLTEAEITVDTNGGSLLPRTDFFTGVELVSDFPASWKSSIDTGIQSAANLGSNWAILSPTWSATSVNPPLFEPVAGSDLLWDDLENVITRMKVDGVQPLLFPQISFSGSSDQFWTNAKRDSGWWQSFFDRYQRFILQNADLAEMMDVSAIIIGDPAMNPAMTDGTLVNGASSSAPINADAQWSQLIQDIRARYSGPIIGCISLPSSDATLPTWINDVDAIYILFSPSLSSSSDSSVQSLRTAFGTQLDSLVLPVYNQYKKTILLGINYPSSNLSLVGCTAINESCFTPDSSSIMGTQPDIVLQSNIYNAGIIESASRSWISGFISREYNPFVMTHGMNSSIYGKPAADVLWFWFHYILNISV